MNITKKLGLVTMAIAIIAGWCLIQNVQAGPNMPVVATLVGASVPASYYVGGACNVEDYNPGPPPTDVFYYWITFFEDLPVPRSGDVIQLAFKTPQQGVAGFVHRTRGNTTEVPLIIPSNSAMGYGVGTWVVTYGDDINIPPSVIWTGGATSVPPPQS